MAADPGIWAGQKPALERSDAEPRADVSPGVGGAGRAARRADRGAGVRGHAVPGLRGRRREGGGSRPRTGDRAGADLRRRGRRPRDAGRRGHGQRRRPLHRRRLLRGRGGADAGRALGRLHAPAGEPEPRPGAGRLRRAAGRRRRAAWPGTRPGCPRSARPATSPTARPSSSATWPTAARCRATTRRAASAPWSCWPRRSRSPRREARSPFASAIRDHLFNTKTETVLGPFGVHGTRRPARRIPERAQGAPGPVAGRRHLAA